MASIKKELEIGRNQNRMGENLLAEFGFIRRRRAAVDEINSELARQGLCADPLITQEMPLRSPRIRFSLVNGHTLVPAATDEGDAEADAETLIHAMPSSFRIGELAAAEQDVGWVAPTASVAEAYTKMALEKFSQLLVAGNGKPRAQDVKGVVSYKSIARASLTSKPNHVVDCLDQVPIVRTDTDLNAVVKELGTYDVVLVEGHDHKIQGIVTAWDLASEFAELVETFKRIGEVEARLRILLKNKLGLQRIQDFLAASAPPNKGETLESLDALTIGELIRLIQNPENWLALGVTAIDQKLFVAALDQMRMFRNRLMHFRDPLNDEEVLRLTHLCELVREVQI